MQQWRNWINRSLKFLLLLTKKYFNWMERGKQKGSKSSEFMVENSTRKIFAEKEFILRRLRSLFALLERLKRKLFSQSAKFVLTINQEDSFFAKSDYTSKPNCEPLCATASQ